MRKQINPPRKRNGTGKKNIKVSDINQYTGQTMKWTETMYPTIATGQFIHWSDEPLDVFAPKETCFWKHKKEDEIYGSGHLYLITVKNRQGLESPYDDEVRFCLKPEDKLQYLGEYELKPTGGNIKWRGGWQPEYRSVQKNPRRRRNSGLPPKLIGYHCGKRKANDAWNSVKFIGRGENYLGGRSMPPNGWGIYFATARSDGYDDMTNQEYYDKFYSWRKTNEEKKSASYCNYSLFPYLSIAEIDTKGLMGSQVDGWFPSPAIRKKYRALVSKHLTEREQNYNSLEKLFKKLGIAETHRALKKIGITGKISGAGYSFEIAVFDPSIITDISVEPMFTQEWEKAERERMEVSAQDNRRNKKRQKRQFRQEITEALRGNGDPWEIYSEYEFDWQIEGWDDLVEWGKQYVENWTSPDGIKMLKELSQYRNPRQSDVTKGIETQGHLSFVDNVKTPK